MAVGVFDLFKLGVGPSSSHTMGPMTAAKRFVTRLDEARVLPRVERIEIALYGSLALTGRGHATDIAVMQGLVGFEPARIDPDEGAKAVAEIRAARELLVGGAALGDRARRISFDERRDILWEGKVRKFRHTNALCFRAFDRSGAPLAERTYFSVGGGFVRDEDEMAQNRVDEPGPAQPHPFESASDLLRRAETSGLTVAGLMLENELALRSADEIGHGLDVIIRTMEACISRGVAEDGVLPGSLKVRRRAHQLYATIVARKELQPNDPLQAMDWVSLWALAVNEENAAGGRVVTAPTNGSAGLIPAVLSYYLKFCGGSREGSHIFLLTAAAIGALYKRNASISGAEVGCQGEVGVACSMAAAGLAAALGGTNAQIENAAEIGMEHNLGLTCDPIGGLVQIPCIERNAMGAVKAIEAARLALLGDGRHTVSLDKVIATMMRTGRDMNEIYKETSLGGLAVNVVEC